MDDPPTMTAQMIVQPIDLEVHGQRYDAEVSVETADGKLRVFRKEARHKVWFEVVNLDTDEAKPIREAQYQINLSAIWWNQRILSGLGRKP